MKNDHYILHTLSNAIDVINVFETESEPLTITELVRKTNINRTTLYRILYTLKVKGLIEQDETTGKYRLGIKMVQLSSLVLQRLSIKQVARPYLEKLKNVLGATVHLVILNDNKAIFIDKIEAGEEIFMGSYIGWVAPLYCTASGKLLLSYQDDLSIQDYLQTVSFKQYTYKTLVDKAQSEQELKQIAAAISISGPTSRITANREKVLKELLHYSRLVSDDLESTSMVSGHRL